MCKDLVQLILVMGFDLHLNKEKYGLKKKAGFIIL